MIFFIYAALQSSVAGVATIKLKVICIENFDWKK